ncbi:MAG: tetrahydromethanopterin S-methyltransferase subunit C [Methanobacteriaceae archaeon]|jgi:tetrahydromethanopterin S-methyltransferase subunit C|nr:tetrahydromethanopterin S-methyltransferase subunit C [Methanobacteriaceae archaeon]
MSHGPSGEPAGSAINSVHLLIVGIVGGLIGIYLTPFVPVVGPIFPALGAVLAIIWGADAIRRVASYGLGTGVPSIAYMVLAIAIIGTLAGLGIVSLPVLKGFSMIAPVLALIFSMIIGLLIAVIAKKIVGMKIPILERCTLEISGAASLSILGFSVALSGSFVYTDILTTVVAPGFIGLFFIMNTMAIQHPYNACLGPNEDQVRTLKCAVSTGFLSMTITGILAMVIMGLPGFAITIIGLIGWIISFRSFVKASYADAASVKWAGLWPKVEE